MKRWQGRVAVVTGASAGIGAAIVEDLVESGMVVVGLARREDRLLEVKNQLKNKGTLHAVKVDISKEEDLKKAFKWIKDNVGGVDVLINNAGVLVNTFTPDGNIEDWRKMYDVNVFALGACSREAINSMKERKVDDGHIININSVASHRLPVAPGSIPYSSSKFASKAITEGLRRELAGQKSKIKVSSVSPGLVSTELFSANSTSSKPMDISHLPHILPKDIADAVHYVLATPPNVQVNELIVRPVGDII
ncbi:farnesol dehydrogenase-like [Homalodisca vitripennis]|uniref:farnesol dehydrogenase-like n=1 Tax=Homalodisca vitripennis TaxID=197043 RepID=UPI001EEA7C41|nr:farnesol dehydrogenase-like [Homalodisca vitripennis]XP_046672674.1 farnesol dehydrogenase-like [Homalodisca vitripennis]KAG8310563.1 Dehydrogenase/reductase SDR member 11 [Homalodisca vitripennis]